MWNSLKIIIRESIAESCGKGLLQFLSIVLVKILYVNLLNKNYISTPKRILKGKFKDKNNGITFVRINSGIYQVGESQADLIQRSQYNNNRIVQFHKVAFSKSYYIAKKLVTNGEFQAFVDDMRAANPEFQLQAENSNNYAVAWDDSHQCHFENGNTVRSKITWRAPFPVNYYSQHGDWETHPVVCVTWNDALAYIKWLNKNWRRRWGYAFTLPSEAMWEVACRAGSNGLFFWKDEHGGENDSKNGSKHLNASSYRQGQPVDNDPIPRYFPRDAYSYTAPVGSYQPNAFGLYDMLGNVYEWCYDGWSVVTALPGQTADNPWGPDGVPDDLPNRVCRGGSWASGPFYTRCAHRRYQDKNTAVNDIGFRVALVRITDIPDNLKSLFGIQ
ncbi:MAG: formylglycine-generating enzyme family protein [Planctomycetaceae bacterium]|nr:formylglycine-generating enzyme family protein [Planctomycetaceae bacterium]